MLDEGAPTRFICFYFLSEAFQTFASSLLSRSISSLTSSTGGIAYSTFYIEPVFLSVSKRRSLF